MVTNGSLKNTERGIEIILNIPALQFEWKMEKTIVHHWSFHDGVTPINPGNRFGETILPRSWTCWVYPKNDQEFVEWMTRMCPTAECEHRFNSGDPMYTVTITKDSEATAFQLMWM
jgi:hypothetical protein